MFSYYINGIWGNTFDNLTLIYLNNKSTYLLNFNNNHQRKIRQTP